MQSRIRIRLEPQDDQLFHRAVDEACATISSEAAEPDSPAAADEAQAYLRSHGYPNATVEYSRSVDEYFKHVSHWFVRRDGKAADALLQPRRA